MLSQNSNDHLKQFIEYCVAQGFLDNNEEEIDPFVNELTGHITQLSQSYYSQLLDQQGKGTLPLSMARRENEFLTIAEQRACREVLDEYMDGLELADLPADINHPETLAAIKKLVGEHKADMAARKIRRCLEKDPEHPELNYLLGRCYVIAGNLQTALQCYQQVLVSNETHSESIHSLATLYLTLGDHDQALATFDKAIALTPDYAGNWHNKGICLFQQEAWADALTAFEKVIELDNEFIGGYINAARCHAALKQNEQALQAFDQALAIDSDNREALKGRGIIHQLQEQHQQAVDDLSRVIQGGAEDLDIYDIRCRSLLEVGQFETALGDAGLIRSHEPYSVEAIQSQFKALLGMKEFHRALNTLNELLEIAPHLAGNYEQEMEMLRSHVLIASH